MSTDELLRCILAAHDVVDLTDLRTVGWAVDLDDELFAALVVFMVDGRNEPPPPAPAPKQEPSDDFDADDDGARLLAAVEPSKKPPRSDDPVELDGPFQGIVLP